MNAIERMLGALVAVALTAGGVALSDLSLSVAPDPDALLRLSWRATARRAQRCRIPTEEELASVPVHMRRSEVCEGGLAPFRLHVAIDGEARIDRELRPAGAREDRPIHVLEELLLPPGPHRVEVGFSVVGESEAAPLSLATTIRPGPRQVILVTRDESGALTAR